MRALMQLLLILAEFHRKRWEQVEKVQFAAQWQTGNVGAAISRPAVK